MIAVRFRSGLLLNDYQRVRLIVRVIQLRSNCSDGAEVGANFGKSADKKVTIVLFLGALFEFGRSAADDLGGSNTISPLMAVTYVHNSNLLLF